MQEKKNYYPVYKNFEASRIEANDAITAMLAGSRLASKTLLLAAGSQVKLGDLFPSVDHIGRFNLSVDKASNVLLDAEHHLAKISIPYIQSLQEDHIKESFNSLSGQGVRMNFPGVRRNNISANNMHEVFFDTCDQHVGRNTSDIRSRADMLEIFHLLRVVRNENTHSGGKYTRKIEDRVADLGEGARSHWKKVNSGDGPEKMKGDDGQIVLNAGHIFTAFSVIKQLGRLVHESFIEAASQQFFAELAVDLFDRTTKYSRGSDQWVRGVIRTAEITYPKGVDYLQGRSVGELKDLAQSLAEKRSSQE